MSDLIDAPPEEDPDTENSGWGDYPLDSVFVRSEVRSVETIVSRIDAKRYVLDPDFQREFVWPIEKQSKLIESCIMRIPLPVFYFAEALDGRVIVVDGLQRLTTFYRFLNNKFPLKGLAHETDRVGSHMLEGKHFDELPLRMQERLKDTQLTTYLLDSKAPERARLDIFDRVNSGSPLTRQQMRNAIYNGRSTVWLRDAANSKPFMRATGGSLDPKTMRDREVINRFCAFFLLEVDSYRSDMDEFLAKALLRMNSTAPDKLNDLRTRFDLSMEANFMLFAEHSFRKSLSEGKARTPVNIALWDVCSVALARMGEAILASEAICSRSRKFLTELILKDGEFVHSITYSTNSTKAVRYRFDAVERALQLALS